MAKVITFEEVQANPLTKASNCKNMAEAVKGMQVVNAYINQPWKPEEKPNKMAAILIHWLQKRKDYYKAGGKYVEKKEPVKREPKPVSKHMAMLNEKNRQLSKDLEKSYGPKVEAVQGLEPEFKRVVTVQKAIPMFKDLKVARSILTLTTEPEANKHLKGVFHHTVGDDYIYIGELKEDDHVNPNYLAQFVRVMRKSDKKQFTMLKTNFTQKS